MATKKTIQKKQHKFIVTYDELSEILENCCIEPGFDDSGDIRLIFNENGHLVTAEMDYEPKSPTRKVTVFTNLNLDT